MFSALLVAGKIAWGCTKLAYKATSVLLKTSILAAKVGYKAFKTGTKAVKKATKLGRKVVSFVKESRYMAENNIPSNPLPSSYVFTKKPMSLTHDVPTTNNASPSIDASQSKLNKSNIFNKKG